MRIRSAFIIVFFSLYIFPANAAFNYPPLNANDIFLTVGPKGEQISLADYLRIKTSDFEILQGRKMKFMEKICFRLSQRKLRSFIDRDGTINNRGVVKLFADLKEERDAIVIGLILGLFANVFGVLFAYLYFKDSYKKKRIKWAWIGLGILCVLIAIFALSVNYL